MECGSSFWRRWVLMISEDRRNRLNSRGASPGLVSNLSVRILILICAVDSGTLVKFISFAKTESIMSSACLTLTNFWWTAMLKSQWKNEWTPVSLSFRLDRISKLASLKVAILLLWLYTHSPSKIFTAIYFRTQLTFIFCRPDPLTAHKNKFANFEIKLNILCNILLNPERKAQICYDFLVDIWLYLQLTTET